MLMIFGRLLHSNGKKLYPREARTYPNSQLSIQQTIFIYRLTISVMRMKESLLYNLTPFIGEWKYLDKVDRIYNH